MLFNEDFMKFSVFCCTIHRLLKHIKKKSMIFSDIPEMKQFFPTTGCFLNSGRHAGCT